MGLQAIEGLSLFNLVMNFRNSTLQNMIFPGQLNFKEYREKSLTDKENVTNYNLIKQDNFVK